MAVNELTAIFLYGLMFLYILKVLKLDPAKSRQKINAKCKINRKRQGTKVWAVPQTYWRKTTYENYFRALCYAFHVFTKSHTPKIPDFDQMADGLR